jgi:hypothetical protein
VKDHEGSYMDWTNGESGRGRIQAGRHDVACETGAAAAITGELIQVAEQRTVDAEEDPHMTRTRNATEMQLTRSAEPATSYAGAEPARDAVSSLEGQLRRGTHLLAALSDGLWQGVASKTVGRG